MSDLRITAQVDMNGSGYQIDCATPDMFAMWLAGIGRMFAHTAGPTSYFRTTSVSVFDAERPY